MFMIKLKGPLIMWKYSYKFDIKGIKYMLY